MDKIDVINAMQDLFIMRNDAFASQNDNGIYIKEDNIITVQLLNDHLDGKKTIGTYTLDKNSMCKWLCIDFDGKNLETEKKKAIETANKIKKEGYDAIIEFSGRKGYHIWVFFNPTNAYSAYEFGRSFVNGSSVEVFPKQTRITETEYGNLVKLPLGIHRVSKKRSYFLHPETNEPMEFDICKDFIFTLSKREKKDIPKVIVKEVVKEIQTSLLQHKAEIPEHVMDFIMTGVAEPGRHTRRWQITRDLWNLGWRDYDEILSYLFEFNKRCDPPVPEQRIRYELYYWIKNHDKYLKPNALYEERLKEELEKKYEERKKIDFLFASDIINMEFPPDTYFIDKLLPEGAIVALAGKRSTFKSWIVYYWCKCILEGKPVWNQFETRPTKILIIDEENRLAMIHKRLKLVFGKDKIAKELAIVNFSGMKVNRDEWKVAIKELINEIKPGIIFVDSITRVHSLEENSADDVNELFTEHLRPMIKDTNITLVFLHHLRKGQYDRVSDDMDELRGSSEFTNIPDCVHLVHRPKGTRDMFVFKQIKARDDTEIFPMKIKVDITDKKADFIFESFIESSSPTLEGEYQGLIKDWARENKIGFAKRKTIIEEIAKMVNRKPDAVTKTIDRSLKGLIQIGLIQKTGRGEYAFGEDIDD